MLQNHQQNHKKYEKDCLLDGVHSNYTIYRSSLAPSCASTLYV